MATRNFNMTLQLDAKYIGERWWAGEEIHQLWNVENMNTLQRSEWGLDRNGWIQYRSQLDSYSIRYSAWDTILNDYYFETKMQPAGQGNYEIGLAFRMKDRYSFYYLTYNGGYADWGGKNIRLMKVIGTQHVKLAEYEYPVFDTKTVYKVRVDLKGNNIKVTWDDQVIFNFNDPNPIPNGAFGPLVMGQEFAKWEGFQAKNVTKFILQERYNDLGVESNYNSPETGKLVDSKTVEDLMRKQLDTYLNGRVYERIIYDAFRLVSSEPRVKLVFDRVPNKNVTSDPTSRIYAYQDAPSVPPVAPINLLGKALSTSSIQLDWTHVDDSEDGFYILDENGETKGIVGVDTFQFVEEGLEENTSYKRKVVAFNVAGRSKESNTVIVKTLQSVPIAPSDFEGKPTGDGEITWTWKDHSFNEASFEIIEWDQYGNIQVIGTVGENVTVFVEKGLTPLKEYTRAVRAKNPAGVSPPSNKATVKTKKDVPPKPNKAPINFYGVGVSDDTIVWSWEDENTVPIDGYELLDPDDNVIATIKGKITNFYESGLYAKMKYRRKIRAFNEGGVGPASLIAEAETLDYGSNFKDKPTAPFNLYIMEVGTDRCKLRWEYNDHPLMPAVGFNLYNELDQVVDTVPLEVRERNILHLNPDSVYYFYVTAYNKNGDSLPSNKVRVKTLKVYVDENENNEDDKTPSKPLDDPLGDLTYDQEKPGMEKIRAFQSGIGDRLDLAVRNVMHTGGVNMEEFDCAMYIKGLYQKEEPKFVDVQFKFRVICSGIDVRNRTAYTKVSEWMGATVRGGEDGITFNTPTKMETPDYITEKKYKIEVQDMKGNPIPMDGTEKGEVKVHWTLDPYEAKDKIGWVQEIYMRNVFNNWKKFSHKGVFQPANSLEMNAWRYKEDTDELICTQNTDTYVGAVSPDVYDDYYIKAQFRSNNWDDDAMAFVVAYTLDEYSREHTISAVRTHSSAITWSLVYNYSSTGQKTLASNIEVDKELVSNDNTKGGWAGFYPNGTIIEVVREGTKITAKTSAAGKTELGYELKIDLDSLPELAKFKKPCHIGVASLSQQDSALKIQEFRGNKTEVYTVYNLRAWTNYKDNVGNQTEWIGSITKTKRMKVKAFEELQFTGRIRSPKYEIPWQKLNEKYFFDPTGYKVVVNCSNPNVNVTLEFNVTDFFPKESTYIDIPMIAKILNHTQTPWNPSIHHGYYYLNHKEHFLFSNPEVLPKETSNSGVYVYNFPYSIRLVGQREYAGKDMVYSDDTMARFQLGMMKDTKYDVDKKVLTLDTEPTGTFISRIFDFQYDLDMFRAVDVKLKKALAGSSYTLEVGVPDENGDVATWVKQNGSLPVEFRDKFSRVRYKLTLNEGQSKEPYAATFPLDALALEKGKKKYITVDGKTIYIDDPTFRDVGTFLTSPMEYGKQIEEMGIVELDMEIPDGGRVELYSVTADEETADFENPSRDMPWIPLELVSQKGKRFTYRVKSAMKRYVVLVAKLFRGLTYTSQNTVTLSADTYVPQWADNVTWGNNGMELVDPSKPGTYQSKATNLGFIKFYDKVQLETTMNNANHKIDIYTVTGWTAEEVEEAAKTESNWKKVVDGQIQSDIRYCIMYRVVLTSGTGTTSPQLQKMTITPLVDTYVSPKLDNIVASATLFNWVRDVPEITSVNISGYIEKGMVAEEYFMPMTGELIANGSEQTITALPTERLAWEWVRREGIPNPDELVLKDFFAEIDPAYPVDLYTDIAGTGYVTGKTTASVGELVKKKEKLYFDEKTQAIEVKPIPQAGTPILITNAQGTRLRQVHFRDSTTGKPTLTNMENLKADETRYLFLEHTGIDPRSAHVWVMIDNKWTEILNIKVVENRIVLPHLLIPESDVRVTYKLLDSFTVDYNYSPKTDVAQIKLHTTFDVNEKESRLLDIQYETNKESAYYQATEVNLNPLHTKISSGFLYLTDEIYPPHKLDIKANPTTLYHGKKDRVTVHGYVKDEHGNPVVGERVDFDVKYGSLEIMNPLSDVNGMVMAIYTAPNNNSLTSDTIEMHVVSRDTTYHVTNKVTINLVKETFEEKLAIKLEKHMATPGDVVQLKVIAMGINYERLMNKAIEVSCDIGSVSPAKGTTNADGELFVKYTVPNTKEKFATITVKAKREDGLQLIEQNILGISGVS